MSLEELEARFDSMNIGGDLGKFEIDLDEDTSAGPSGAVAAPAETVAPKSESSIEEGPSGTAGPQVQVSLPKAQSMVSDIVSPVDSISNISISVDQVSSVESDSDVPERRDTPQERAKVLAQIQKKSKQGYPPKRRCNINTPLTVLEEELAYIMSYKKHEDSLKNYQQLINNGVYFVEMVSGMVPSSIIDLEKFYETWTVPSSQAELEDIVERLELEYGSLEYSPLLSLGIMLLKTAVIVNISNQSAKRGNTLGSTGPAVAKKTKKKMTGPSARARAKAGVSKGKKK